MQKTWKKKLNDTKKHKENEEQMLKIKIKVLERKENYQVLKFENLKKSK